MVFICDKCGFLFERVGVVDSCPVCDKASVRASTSEEEAEFIKKRELQKEAKRAKV